MAKVILQLLSLLTPKRRFLPHEYGPQEGNAVEGFVVVGRNQVYVFGKVRAES